MNKSISQIIEETLQNNVAFSGFECATILHKNEDHYIVLLEYKNGRYTFTNADLSNPSKASFFWSVYDIEDRENALKLFTEKAQ